MGPRLEPGSGTIGGYTHICFVKQLLCLYPFPQRSQRSSLATRFPSPRFRFDPSLARRFLLLVLTGFAPEALPSAAEFSSIALGEVLRSEPAFTLRDKEDDRADVAPRELDSRPLRPARLRRCDAIGMVTGSPLSFMVAATAAAALAAAAEAILFRRVTRWLVLTAPSDIECACEWFRALLCRTGRPD